MSASSTTTPKVIGRRAIAARDHQIVELGIFESHAAVHVILDHHLALERIFEADHRLDPGARVRPIAPPPVVAWFFLTGHLLRA
jgi:hypothetical protein